MILLKSNQYQGFKLGVRVADSYGLQADVTRETDSRGLHAIKNIANTMMLQHELHVVGINNRVYTRD